MVEYLLYGAFSFAEFESDTTLTARKLESRDYETTAGDIRVWLFNGYEYSRN